MSASAMILFAALTIVGALVIIPRPTYPQILPLPHIDPSSLSAREELEMKRAREALDESLDKETRAVGEQVRRLGIVLSTGGSAGGAQLKALRADTQAVRTREARQGEVSGEESLLRLRALQGEMFLAAVRRWVKTKEVDTDLRELGGLFYRVAGEAWLDESGELILTRDELRLFFRMHWGKLTGVHGEEAFGPSLEEYRRYYSTNLRHPGAPIADERGRAMMQHGFATALGKVDPNYPAALAEGILLVRMGEGIQATGRLQEHLLANPEGRWANIARNHLMSATRLGNSASPSP